MTDWNDPVVRRFIVKTEPRADGCWDWLGSVKPNGYGYFRHPETQLAHRAAWLLMRGPIPDGKEIDHLCRNVWCTNPDHLEPVTHRTNVMRGDRGVWWESCKKYHPTDQPRWQKRKDGRVYCKECSRVREQRRRDRRALRAARVEAGDARSVNDAGSLR